MLAGESAILRCDRSGSSAMPYPTLEQYKEAFQHPRLVLLDPELREGRVETDGLGLPRAMCGGFALTFTVACGGSRHAVRCFHRQSDHLERRYHAIAAELGALASPYFVRFAFQPEGIRLNGGTYPVVRMEWAEGSTLGEFVERHHGDAGRLAVVRTALRDVAAFLETQSLAHGDVQPGNVMVSVGGRRLRLIDYDGMYVDALRRLGNAERGQANFQHPQRDRQWDGTLDRFSFLALDVALAALERRPQLWDSTQSDADAFLFKANDYADPARSAIFRELARQKELAPAAERLAAVCRGPFAEVPSLAEFTADGSGRAAGRAGAARPAAAGRAPYIAAFPVVDGADYFTCDELVGERVELVGRIVQVQRAATEDGERCVFLNFGRWEYPIVKVILWKGALAPLMLRPDETWEGRWVSVTGLLDPPNPRARHYHGHLSVGVNHPSELHFIGEEEARYRLAGGEGLTRARVGEAGRAAGFRLRGAAAAGDNQRIVAGMRAAPPAATGSGGGASRTPAPQGSGRRSPATAGRRRKGPASVNQQTVKAMQDALAGQQSPAPGPAAQAPVRRPAPAQTGPLPAAQQQRQPGAGPKPSVSPALLWALVALALLVLIVAGRVACG